LIKFLGFILLITLVSGCSHVPLKKSSVNLTAKSWLSLKIVERNRYDLPNWYNGNVYYYRNGGYRFLSYHNDYCEIDIIFNNTIVETRNIFNTHMPTYGIFASFLIPTSPGRLRIDIEYSDCHTEQNYRYTVVDIAPNSLVSVEIGGESITAKTRPYIQAAL